MMKGSIQEENIIIVNIYAPNIGTNQYIRQLLTAIKEEIDSSTTIVGNFNTSLTPMDRSSKMKINKETEALNDTIDQIDLIDILWDIPFQTSRLHFLLKCTRNILQGRSHIGSQIKPQ